MANKFSDVDLAKFNQRKQKIVELKNYPSGNSAAWTKALVRKIIEILGIEFNEV